MRRVPLLRGIDMEVAPPPAPRVPPPEARWQPGTSLRLVSWGGLVPGKGLHVLVDAAEGLVEAERVAIEHFGHALDDGYGEYGRDDMAHRFPAFDAAVFPSFFLETHGFTVDEALALGLPVIVSDRGAPPARVGSRGLVFPAGDERALRGILQRLLDDPATLAKLRAGSPAAPVRTDDHVALLAEKYRQALAARR
jgi:glycosyltransferase involved in cell wall biosynthesis